MGTYPEIEILKGDITDMDVDAVVNAANTALMLGSGVAGAIRKKGGPAIQAECDLKSPIPLGEAVITGAGDLRARHVIHAAGMHPGGGVSAESLVSATLNSLRMADEENLGTIAFPAIGTGVGGFPVAECAALMIDTVCGYLDRRDSGLEKIYFVLFDDAAEKVFSEALRERRQMEK